MRAPGVPEKLCEHLSGVGGGLLVRVAPRELVQDGSEVMLACGEEKDVVGGAIARTG
jgi:hypothetical protein